MTIEQQKENSPKFREIERVSKQVKEELKRFNKEKFYEKDGDEIVYNMDTVKEYLGVLKDKKTWRELISKNSSAMVMAVQIALYSQNYDFGTIDGILGDKTKESIKKFQADKNLPVDPYGRSLPSTIQKLLDVISKEDQVEIPQDEKEEAQKIMEENESKDKNELNEGTNSDNKEELHDDLNTQNEGQKSDNGLKQDNEVGDNVSNLEQDTIRPEVQKWLDSPSRNSDDLKQLTSITYAEAVAISEKGGYYLDLSGIKKIDEKSFEELLKHIGLVSIGLENLTPELAKKLVESGKGITFSGLEKIDNFEVYQILGRTNGTLRFDVLKNISDKEMGELVKKLSGDIYLDAVENIDPNIAEEISKYPRDISLNGVKNISKKTAEVLSNKKLGKLYLEGLKAPLDENLLEGIIQIPIQHLVVKNDVILQIYNYKKQKEREGKNLSQIVLDFIDNKINDDELSKLDHITYDDAQFLAASGKFYLDLSGIKEITPDIFEALLKFKGGIKIGIENLTPELAKKLEQSGKGITFSGLEKIDNFEVYQILGRTNGTLRFDVLKNISDKEMGELVKKPSGDIYLDAVENIDLNIAEEILKYPRDISLNGVKKIDKDTAEKLSKKIKGKLYMKGLEAPVDEDILESLIKIPANVLSRNGLNNDLVQQIYKYKKQKEESENQ